MADTPPPPPSSAGGAEVQRYLKVLSISSAIVAAFLIAAALHLVESVFRPFFVAVFLCFLVRPAVGKLARRSGSKLAGYTLAVLLILGALYLGWKVVVASAADFGHNRATYLENLRGYYQSVTASLEGTALRDALPSQEEIERLLVPDLEAESAAADVGDPAEGGNLGRDVLSSIAAVIGSGTQALLDLVAELLVIAVFMMFMLVEADRFPARMRQAFGDADAARILAAVGLINADVQRFVTTKVAVSVITAVLAMVVMWLFGVHYLVMFGIAVFVLNFIPYIGSLIATAAPVLIALLQFPTPWRAVWLALALTVVQQAVGNFVEPRLQGKGLQLSPVAILLSLAFWGWLWGITGMVLAVPITVTIRIALAQFESTRLLAVLMSDPDAAEGMRAGVGPGVAETAPASGT